MREETNEMSPKEIQKTYFEFLVSRNKQSKEEWVANVLPKWRILDKDIQEEMLPELISNLYQTNFSARAVEMLDETSIEVKEKSLKALIGKFIGPDAEIYPGDYNVWAMKDFVEHFGDTNLQQQIFDEAIQNIDYLEENPFSYFSRRLELLKAFVLCEDEEFVKRNSEKIVECAQNLQGEISEPIDALYCKKPELFYTDEFFKQKTQYEWIYELDLDFIKNPELTAKFVKYTEFAVSRNEFATTENRIVAQMQQLILNEAINNSIQASLTPEERKKLEDIFENIKNNEKEPDMGKYDGKIDTLEYMEDEEYESFLADLKRYRNKYGIFPEKYCDYMIKQAIDTNSNMNKKMIRYSEEKNILERVFEDKARYVLEKEGINDYFISTTSALEQDVDGQCDYDQRTIRLDEYSVRNIEQYECDAINTVYHECRHAIKNRNIYDSDYLKSGLEYKMIKEDILRSIDEDFYNENYEYMICEIDARMSGATNQVKLLKKLGLSDKVIMEGMTKEIFKDFRKDILEEHEKKDTTVYKKVFDGDETFVNKRFSELILRDPDIISQVPILALEYYDDGRRKPGIEILKDYEQALKSTKEDYSNAEQSNIRIYPYILNDVVYIQNEQAISDVDMLLDYEPSTRAMRKFRDRIVRNEVLAQIDTWKREGGIKLESNDAQSEEEKKELLKQTVSRLNDFVLAHPEEAISKEISGKIEVLLEKEISKPNLIQDIAEIDKTVTIDERTEIKDKLSSLKTASKVVEKVDGVDR